MKKKWKVQHIQRSLALAYAVFIPTILKVLGRTRKISKHQYKESGCYKALYTCCSENRNLKKGRSL
jgi:hypothetical protein